jgi:hypothetical protein
LVNSGWVLPISRVWVSHCGGRGAEDGSGRFLGSGEGGGFVVAGDSEPSPAAYFASAEVEAVGTDRLLPAADDAFEGSAALAFCLSAHAAVVSGLLELGEEVAGTISELPASAEVDGALAAGDAVGNTVGP